MAKPVTVNDVLDGHVALDLECLDRIYLNAYVPNLQVGGQVVSFLTAHLGYPIPSPAIFDKIGTAFRRAVARFADEEHIPVVRFTKTDRKIEKMRPYLAAQAADRPVRGGRDRGRAGVRERVHRHPTRRRPTGCRGSPFTRPTAASPATTSTSGTTTSGRRSSRSAPTSRTRPRSGSTATSGPNARPLHAGIGFTELSNGFAATDDPARLAGDLRPARPGQIAAFAERWFAVLPLPLTAADQAGGLLVGALDAPGRGLAHHRVRRNRGTPAGSSRPWSPTTSTSAAPSRSS